MIADYPCRWRGAELAPGRFACHSPKLVAKAGVTEAACAKCYCRDHEPVAEAPDLEQLGTALAKAPAPARKALPCVYLGDALPVDRGAPMKKFHDCEHPDQPLGAKVCSCQGCGPRCPGYKADDGQPELKAPVSPVRAAFIAEFREAVAKAKAATYPEGRFQGTGVVIPAGGWKMLPGVFVTASMLRWDHINSRLPIEVWYIGDEGEFDPIFADITADLGVVWRDISEELRRLGIDRKERLWGWACKPLALMLSSFERVVMMDADCYPVYDPERLWADPRIAKRAAAFWPDNPGHVAGRPLTADQWDAFGLAPVDTPGFESGQMLVDKRRSWAALQVGAFLSDRMDYFDGTRADRGKVRIHGDKELFSIAWNATRTPYWMAPPVEYREVAFLQKDPDGLVAFVHRCNDKPKIDFAHWKHTNQATKDSSVNFRSTVLHHDHMIHHYIGQLRELLRPTLPGFRDGTQDEQIWREVRVSNAYRLPKRMDGMRVIDVGAHAGFFTHECARRGAELVLAVEPYFPNVERARINLAPWTRKVSLYERAVAAPGVASVEMRGGHAESNTGEPYVAGLKGLPGGVSVPTVTLDELIERCGRVDLLKIDCEGSEYPAILTATRLGQVDRIAGEFHTHGLAHHPRELRAALESAGFVVEMDETQPIGTFHATRPEPTEGPPAAAA